MNHCFPTSYRVAALSLATFICAILALPVGSGFQLIAYSPVQETAQESVQQSVQEQPETAEQVDGTLLPTGRRINPAGESLSFHGRPVDLVVSPDNTLLFVKDRSSLRIIDIENWVLVQSIDSPDGASLYGLKVLDNGVVIFTNAKNGVHLFGPLADGTKTDNGHPVYELQRTIELPADSFPCGLTVTADSLTAFVCLSKTNSVAELNLADGTVVREFKTGVAPFDVVLDTNANRLFVSNIGGRFPVAGDKTAPSAETETVVDARGVAATGTVSVVDLATGAVTNQIDVGRHPSVIQGVMKDATGGHVLVCNTNDDSISFVTDVGCEQSWIIKPDAALPFGSMPSALLVDHQAHEQSQRVFIALAGNNCIAVRDLAVRDLAAEGDGVTGLIPTGWYPAALAQTDTYLFVANIKGEGSRAVVRDESKGRNSHDHLGSVQRIALSDIADPAQLAAWTEQIKTDSRVPQILRANLAPISGEGVAPVPCPEKTGQPSVFKHVIYVIKENRTFDQVFGDIDQFQNEPVRSEPALCVFPREITPNHHALAERFGILDNYYCNGVLSADGHSWATEGNVTPYLERAFGGFARSYTFGDDPITYSSSGFLWDRFLDAGYSFRNYGEMNYSEPPEGMKFQEIWNAYSAGEPIVFEQKIGIERVKRYSSPDYPGWNMVIPDVLRMDRFLKEFREFENNDGLPTLCLIYLPQDHLGGGVTSRAHMADNDLALGRLVDAVSHSKYWNDTLIIVNEDDPQNGYDHIDGHRSLCLVISAYSHPGVNHSFYNQTSVLRTMLHLFGLPPLNQQDASTPLMADCFQATPDINPYDAIDASVPLNETQADVDSQSSLEREWRAKLATVPIARTGMKTPLDEDNLNRFVWHEMRGWETPYPVEFAGPHAQGLKQLGLELDPDHDE